MTAREELLFTTRRCPWQRDAAPSMPRCIQGISPLSGGYCGVPPPPLPPPPRPRPPARVPPAARPPSAARRPPSVRRPPGVRAIVLRSEIERAIVLKSEIERPIVLKSKINKAIVLGHAPHCSRVYCVTVPILQLLISAHHTRERGGNC